MHLLNRLKRLIERSDMDSEIRNHVEKDLAQLCNYEKDLLHLCTLPDLDNERVGDILKSWNSIVDRYLDEYPDSEIDIGVSDQIFSIDQSSNKSLMHYACQRGPADLVENLIVTYSQSLSCVDDEGKTPLHMACMNSDDAVDTVELLFNHGATINFNDENWVPDNEGEVVASAVDVNGCTPLHEACYNNNIKIVKLLLDRGADACINFKNNEGDTPLHLACSYSESSLVTLLLENDAYPDAQNKHGYTPLHFATGNSDAKVMRQLVTHGANINAQDVDDKSVLHHACSSSNLAMVDFLLQEGVKLDGSDKEGQTPLHIACMEGHSGIVGLLLKARNENGYDINAVDNLGRTPLHRACHYGHFDVVKRLISEEGVTVKIDNDGKTPLMSSHSRQYGTAVEYFWDQCLKNNNLSKNLEAWKMLLEKDTKATKFFLDEHRDADYNASVLLTIATKYDCVAMVQFLLENHVPVNNHLQDHDVPLSYACKNYDIEMLKVLLKSGYSERSKLLMPHLDIAQAELLSLIQGFEMVAQFMVDNDEQKDSDAAKWDTLKSELSDFAINLLQLYYEVKKKVLQVKPGGLKFFEKAKDVVSGVTGHDAENMAATTLMLIQLLKVDHEQLQGHETIQLKQNHIDTLNVGWAIKETRLHRMATAIYRAGLPPGFCEQVELTDEGKFSLNTPNKTSQPGP